MKIIEDWDTGCLKSWGYIKLEKAMWKSARKYTPIGYKLVNVRIIKSYPESMMWTTEANYLPSSTER